MEKGLLLNGAREAIKDCGLVLKSGNNFNGNYPMYIFHTEGDIPDIILHHKGLPDKDAETHEFERGSVITRRFLKEYNSCRIVFDALEGLEKRMEVEPFEHKIKDAGSGETLTYALSFRKHVDLTKGDRSFKKLQLEYAINDLLGLSRFIKSRYEHNLRSEKREGMEEMQTSADALVRRLQQYGYDGEKHL
jgi:adenylate cyclase class IV